MAKYNIMILERINEDNLVVDAKKLSKRKPPTGGDGGHGNGGKPRKTMEERVANVIKELVPNMIAEAINPINFRLDRIEQQLGKVENVLERNNLH